MFKKITFLFTLLCVAQLFAGQNLIMNGDLDSTGKSFPSYWMFRNHSDGIVTPFNQGGPDNQPFIRIESKRAAFVVRQNGLELVPGGKYKLSAYIRSKGLKGKNSGVTIAGNSVGIKNLPENQPEWKFYEVEFTLDDGKNYKFDLMVDDEGGQLDVAQVRLIPISQDAVKGSKSQLENMDPTMVPLGLLNYIPAHKPELPFFLIGSFPGAPENWVGEFTIDGKKKIRIPLTDRRATLNLSAVALGKHRVDFVLRDTKSGKTLLSDRYDIRIVTVPQADPNGVKLNNLVVKLRDGVLRAGEKFKVINHRNGWVLFRFKSSAGSRPVLKLDGKLLFNSAFRGDYVIKQLDAGVYELSNCGGNAEVDIRLIPDIHIFPLGSTRVPGNEPYDWRFAKKYMLPALTTINEGGFSPAERQEVRDYGLKFLANFGVLNPKKPNDRQDLLDRMTKAKAIADDNYDGMTMDEVEYWDFPAINPYAWALKHFPSTQEKEIRSWIIGPPSQSYCNYISAAANASQGHGKILYEVYNRGQFTKGDADNYFRQISQHINFYRDITPGLFNNLCIILGNYSQAPMISLDQITHVDYRYYLDMQMNILANNPAADGLNGVGFWGCHNCDEEILRWSFALLKHYAIDGNKGMLSDKYGYSYHNRILKNGDFEDGLEGWSKTGNVTIASHEKYGSESQRRYGSVYKLGDKFAVLTRDAGPAAQLRQKLTGLTPGKKYCIFYMVADYDHILTGKNQPQRFKLNLDINNGDICRRSYFVDDRNRPNFKARVNSCKYVFVARGTEAEVVFTNANADIGSRLALNYIYVRPYFPTEEK